jgi:hypothetical protein
MSETPEDLAPLLPSRKGNEKRFEENLFASIQDARALKLTVIPDTYLNVPPSPVTHPGESVWWLPAKRGTDKWLQCKKLNPQDTVSKQKTDRFLSPKVRAVKRFEPGSMNPNKPGHGIMLRLLNISSRVSDLFMESALNHLLMKICSVRTCLFVFMDGMKIDLEEMYFLPWSTSKTVTSRDTRL